MGEDQKRRSSKASDQVIEKTDALLTLLEKISNRRDTDFTPSYEDLKKLKKQVEERRYDPELVDTASTTLSDMAQKMVKNLLKDKQLPKVKITKMSRRQGTRNDLPPSVVGWEVYRPRVGKRYKVFKEDGGIFMTSNVTKVLTGYVRTKNSVYQIEVLK